MGVKQVSYEDSRLRLIKRVHESIPGHIERLSWTRKKLAEFQTARLRDILETSYQKSPYYREILKGIDISSFTLNDLPRLPVLKKDTVMQNWDYIVSVEGINRKIAEEHLEKLRDGERNNPYYKDQFLFVATGGSSGKRGLFVWDEEFLSETVCTCFRSLALEESKRGNEPIKMAVLEAPSTLHGSRHLFSVSYAPNVEVLVLDSIESADKQHSKLNDFQPDFLIGFASVVAEQAHAQIRGALDIKPRWVSTNSEPLDDEMREVIRNAWGTYTCNSWGSVEIGLVAMETPQSTGMIIGEDCVILEVVDNNLQPAKDVKEARKVVATSLINKTFPLIRYVIDDVLELEEDNTHFPAFREIKSILGRSDDWFKYKNCRIHPMAFRHVLGQIKEIEEYQITQTENGADIIIVSPEGLNTDMIQRGLTNNLLNEGMNDPKINIKLVESLPRHPETGKVKRFITLKT